MVQVLLGCIHNIEAAEASSMNHNGHDEIVSRTPLLLTPSSPTCTDFPVGWYDNDGPEFDCNYYAQDDNCEKYGDLFSNHGKTAKEACCVCGGGSNLGSSPPLTGGSTKNPSSIGHSTMSPSSAIVSTKSPTSMDHSTRIGPSKLSTSTKKSPTVTPIGNSRMSLLQRRQVTLQKVLGQRVDRKQQGTQ